MADCKNCHYGAEGGGGNFGFVAIVCCYYGSLECDPAGDCQNFETKETCPMCGGELVEGKCFNLDCVAFV